MSERIERMWTAIKLNCLVLRFDLPHTSRLSRQVFYGDLKTTESSSVLLALGRQLVALLDGDDPSSFLGYASAFIGNERATLELSFEQKQDPIKRAIDLATRFRDCINNKDGEWIADVPNILPPEAD